MFDDEPGQSALRDTGQSALRDTGQSALPDSRRATKRLRSALLDQRDERAVRSPQAMTAAIFGLVGVLVGGLLNGLVSWLVELSRQRDAARASARLLSHELARNDRILDQAVRLAGAESKEDPDSAAEKLSDLSQAEWVEHRTVLARGLGAGEFKVLSSAYIHLDEIDAAARRLRAIATASALSTEKTQAGTERGGDSQTSADRIAAAAAVSSFGSPLSAVISAVSTVLASPEFGASLRKGLAMMELRRARERTQAALAVAESVAEDPASRRIFHRRRSADPPRGAGAIWTGPPRDPPAGGLGEKSSIEEEAVASSASLKNPE